MRKGLFISLIMVACDGGGSGVAAGPGGLGAACDSSADCTPGLGLHCPGPNDPSDLGFCTKLCDHLADAAADLCGDDAACVYVGAGGRCVPPDRAEALARPLPVSQDSPAGRVNDLGVGQPCVTGQDCTGTGAKLCEKGQRDGGFDFCSIDCIYAGPTPVHDECGPGGACVFAGGGFGRCVPEVDAERLAQAAPEIPEVAIPCERQAAANDSGVGHPCTVHADCSQFTIASQCPQAIRPGLPNWCSHLCDFGDHEACGPGAFCYWRPAESGGMVGSCAPDSCRLSE